MSCTERVVIAAREDVRGPRVEVARPRRRAFRDDRTGDEPASYDEEWSGIPSSTTCRR